MDSAEDLVEVDLAGVFGFSHGFMLWGAWGQVPRVDLGCCWWVGRLRGGACVTLRRELAAHSTKIGRAIDLRRGRAHGQLFDGRFDSHSRRLEAGCDLVVSVLALSPRLGNGQRIRPLAAPGLRQEVTLVIIPGED